MIYYEVPDFRHLNTRSGRIYKCRTIFLAIKRCIFSWYIKLRALDLSNQLIINLNSNIGINCISILREKGILKYLWAFHKNIILINRQIMSIQVDCLDQIILLVLGFHDFNSYLRFRSKVPGTVYQCGSDLTFTFQAFWKWIWWNSRKNGSKIWTRWQREIIQIFAGHFSIVPNPECDRDIFSTEKAFMVMINFQIQLILITIPLLRMVCYTDSSLVFVDDSLLV